MEGLTPTWKMEKRFPASGNPFTQEKKTNQTNTEMKRFSILCLLLMVSCTTDDQEVDRTPAGRTPVKFYAEIEGAQSRTHVDGRGLTCWNENDRITIYTGETYNREFAFDGETGAVSGGYDQVSIDKSFYSAYDVDANYAIYPHRSTNQLKPYNANDPSTGAYFVTTLPTEQLYAPRSFGSGSFPMVARTQDPEDGRLLFKNVSGCILLNLYGADRPISQVSIEGNNGEKIAGKAQIEYERGNHPLVTMQSDAQSRVTLLCGEGLELASSEESPTEMWIAIPPTLFSKGFTITVEAVDGTTFTKTTTKQQTVERNTFLVMPAIRVDFWGEGSNAQIEECQKIYYTSVDELPVEPYDDSVFGANLMSNYYTNGQGVMVFDGPVTEIGQAAFHMSNITTIKIPDTVTEISGLAPFSYCFSLRSFSGQFASTDGRSLVCEGYLCGVAPAGLKQFNIPDGVEQIGWFAFEGCTELEEINIPESVTMISTAAFMHCTALKQITIPEHVESFMEKTFWGCSSLSAIYMKPTTPPLFLPYNTSLGYHTFEGIAEDAKIYVPQGLGETYRAARIWSDYAAMIIEEAF